MLTEPAQPRPRAKRARPQAKRRRVGLSALKARRVLGMAAGALCVAALGGIAFNALSLQKTRHPAPLFAHAPTVLVEKGPVASEFAAAPPPAPPPRAELAAPPRAGEVAAAKPAVAEKAAVAPAHAVPVEAADATPRDAISQLLLGKPHEAEQAQPQAPAAPSRMVMTAQKALVKLGFVLKADGVMGGTTKQAIERYERDHHRVSNGELTPAVMRRLAAELGEPIN